MAKKTDGQSVSSARGVHAASTSPAQRAVKRDESRAPQAAARPSALVDTRVIYCGDNLDQLQKLPDACVDLIYSATAGRPRCVQLARVLKKTGRFYYHCDWHASHYVKVMLIFGQN